MAVTIRARVPVIVLATILVMKAAATALATTAAATVRTMGRRIPLRTIMAMVLLEPVRRMEPIACRPVGRAHTMALLAARRAVYINPK